MKRLTSYVVALCAIIAVVVIYWNTDALWKNNYDDAYITYRYAVNLAEHGQLVFNLGERTDAASSFLFTIILAAFYRIGFHNVEMVVFLINMLSIGTVSFFLFHIIRYLTGSILLASVLSLLGAVHGVLSVWSILGMETVFFAALILAVISAWISERMWMLAFCMLMVSLARPEGILIPLTLIVVELMSGWLYKPLFFLDYEKRRYRLNIFFFVCVIMVVFYSLKYLYYGSAIPNSVYIKLMSNQISILRYIAPLYPIGIIGVALILSRIKCSILKYSVVMFMIIQTAYVTYAARAVAETVAHQSSITLRIGEYIRDNVSTDNWILSSELGAYAYRAINHRFIDGFGLTSGDVLNAYRHDKNIDSILYEKQPLYIADTFHLINGEYRSKNMCDFRFLTHPLPPSQYLAYGYRPILLVYSDRNIYFMFGNIMKRMSQ